MANFDLEKTRELMALFRTPVEQRDGAWRQLFYAAVPEASLAGFDPQVNRGPDTFLYFHMAVPDPGPLTPFCVAHILDYAIEQGYGVAIFGDKSRAQPPEWVFTYGDLLSYKLYATFEGAPPEPVSPGGNVLVASPNESFLPLATRRVIGRFMRHNYKHPDPKVALINGQSLMFNLTLAHYQGDQGRLDSAMRYLGWFLPRSYGLMALPADWSDTNFASLP